MLCDYAMRYSEVVAVKAIDAECIAEELVQIFARVGIPEKILTDQDSNFMSQLLFEIYQLLHVHQFISEHISQQEVWRKRLKRKISLNGEEGRSVNPEWVAVAQLEQLLGLLHEFRDVMNSAPGRTTMAEHNVRPTDSKPIRLALYRLQHAYCELVRKEIDDIQVAGIIEPSRSEWTAPIVLVNKKDSTMCMCVWSTGG